MKTLLVLLRAYIEDEFKDLKAALKEKSIAFVPVPDTEPVDAELIQKLLEDRETLIATDSPEIYNDLREGGRDAVCIAGDESDIDLFNGARYIVMSPGETEPLYYERVWMRFNDIPWQIAETERMIIRETVESDADVFFEMYKDPEMTRYTEKLYENIDDEKKYIREYRDKVYAVQGFGIWTLVRKSDHKIIGRAGLITRAGFDDVETGYAVGTAYQGLGYAREAVSKCMELAKELGFDAVYALTDKENAASVKLLKALDFKYRDECVVDGTSLIRMTRPV